MLIPLIPPKLKQKICVFFQHSGTVFMTIGFSVTPQKGTWFTLNIHHWVMFAPPKWLYNGRSTWVKTHVIVGSCIRYRYQKMNSWSQKKWQTKNPTYFVPRKINFKNKTFKPSCLILVTWIYMDVETKLLDLSGFDLLGSLFPIFFTLQQLFHAVHPTSIRTSRAASWTSAGKGSDSEESYAYDIRQRWAARGMDPTAITHE